MTTAGYSGTPLPRKLGIKEGHTVALINAPDGFDETLAPLPDEVTLRTAARGRLDVVVFFTRRAVELRRRYPVLARNLEADGGLWVGWPKRSSGVETDLAFDVVQTIGLATGMVDNKVCALDDTWSGLRFVVRVENRSTWPESLRTPA